MLEALDRLTVKLSVAVPVFGSATVASLTEIAGSRSWMVAVPVALASVPALGADRLSAKASLASTSASAFTATVTTLLVSPAAKVSVPEVAV